MSEERPRFRRPWEDPGEEEDPNPAAVDPPPAPSRPPGGESASPASAPPELDLSDWEAMTAAPSSLDEYSHQSYVAATTEEYRGLAEEIARLSEAEFEAQAVAASIPGLEAGVVGFEDFTGRRGPTPEEVEAVEQARSSDLALRVGSALALIGLLAGSLYLGGWWFTGFIALVMLVSVGEFYATVRRVGFAPLALVGLLGVVAIAVFVHRGGIHAIAGVTVVAIVVVALVYSLASRRNPLENASVTIFGMLWVALLAFVIPIAQSPRPLAYVVLAGLVIAVVDIGSYFVGRGFGSRGLAPVLSPHKTVEGFMGGVFAAVLTGAVLSTFPPYEELGFWGAVGFALLMGLVAPVGDLAESMVKRSLGVKDMGSVLPGHGGMLDRIDGFLFAVPVAYLFLFWRGLL